MWIYEKKLEYPVRVSGPNPRLAKYVITQYGGPEGELSASLRYLNMRYTMPTGRAKNPFTGWHDNVAGQPATAYGVP
ncbi:MAG: manganese catalase family protein [Peptococcaceae bacterium]|nr:manganese catalase family protein [Peptococcaceae bacterium]